MTDAGAAGVIVKPVDVRLAELWGLSGIHRVLAKCFDVSGSVGFMRQLWGSKIAPRSMFASNGDLGAPHPSALAKDDPLQTMLVSILESIGVVLGTGYQPKIFDAVVRSVAVDMVDLFRPFVVRDEPRQLMRHLVFFAQHDDAIPTVNDASGHVTTAAVDAWFVPSKDAGLRIVVDERPNQIRRERQFRFCRQIGAAARMPAKYQSGSLSFVTTRRDAENLSALTTGSIKHARFSAISATLAVA